MRRKRVDSEDDLDNSKDTLSDTTPPPSIVAPRKSKSVSKSPKKAKTSSSAHKKSSNRPNKVKGFLGAIELTSGSEDEKKSSKSKATPQSKKKRPSSPQVINLCSDEEMIPKSPTKKNNYIIENDVVVILSSSDDERVPSSSKIPPPEDKNADDMDCDIYAPESPEEQLPSNSPQSSEVNASEATTTLFSPFSASPTNLPPRTIVFSDSMPPTFHSQTSLYFSRTLASVQSHRQRLLKSTKSTHRINSRTEPFKPARPDVQPSPLPLSPSCSLSPSIQSGSRKVFQSLSILTEALIPPLNTDLVGSPSKNTPPGPLAAATNPLFLPSPTPDDIVFSDSISAMETIGQPVCSTPTSEDAISNDQPLLTEGTTSDIVATTPDTTIDVLINDFISTTTVQTATNEPSTEALILSSTSQMFDISAYSDIPGIDSLDSTDAMDEDLDGLELGYPEWSP